MKRSAVFRRFRAAVLVPAAVAAVLAAAGTVASAVTHEVPTGHAVAGGGSGPQPPSDVTEWNTKV
ncbi:hypothetical protein [Saccharothrix sp. ST-888]|uniref:hypothetical protein n=1 Tax=Saccharothrix sp. ST-888 TaxID=1427391 RepID=UPI000AB2DD25|nr:hypothetical protein [Saccharothrix sp. ST-888]